MPVDRRGGLASSLWPALCVLLCCPVPTPSASGLDDVTRLAELALARYQPPFSPAANVTESLLALLGALQGSKLTGTLGAVNCTNADGLGAVLCGAGSECLPVGALVAALPAEGTLAEALARLCPLLLFQLHHQDCSFTPPQVRGRTRPTTGQVWGFGVLSVFVVSCCSLAGLVLVPFLSHGLYHVLLMVFEGLAVGSLLGSAVFHLIPQAFNLLGHDREHDYLWKSLIVFLGIYLFYLSDKLMRFIADYRQRRSSQKAVLSVGHPLTNGCVPSEPKVGHPAEHQGHEHGLRPGDSVAAVAWMVIFGDGMHNFIDGLSIGAAFSESLLAGASISVAVVCEEFPHELGDFAVLLSAGMSTRQAVAYNFLSALTCFLGLGVGILVGDFTQGAPHIFALAAGMFLYISLVAMMGELNEALEAASGQGLLQSVRVFLLQNVGIIVGVALLFLMAKYSEKIDFEPGAMPPGVRITAASLGAGTHSGDSRAVFGAVGL
ncbi:metal cation symporter ZIP14 [Ixodes scapularis]|uniref:metal cation symporter ZIP14 n=1 Tax=Ixodes scapularis TaxID=6945 RepID=UPI001AD6FF0F|nr:metal cation symporter ZIP14 [Ixodes scapularis]